MMKLFSTFAASILIFGVSVSTHAVAANDGASTGPSTTGTARGAANQPRSSATTQSRKSNSEQTHMAQMPGMSQSRDDQTEETAKMPGTTGPRNTPRGGAGLSYPSTE
jgi:hypothetical protein